MHLHECPDCSYLFGDRKGRRCPKCGVLIVHVGEWYSGDDDRVFICDKKENIRGRGPKVSIVPVVVRVSNRSVRSTKAR